MAVRDDFAPGEVLAAADLNDTFGSKLDLAGGKILQIVRATDSTTRSTTSATFVDVTGMSVTITPQKSDSAVLIVTTFLAGAQNSSTGNNRSVYRITDSSDNAVSGAEVMLVGTTFYTQSSGLFYDPVVMIGRVTPATTSAVTYKLRFRREDANVTAFAVNGDSTGQMYAIEVSA